MRDGKVVMVSGTTESRKERPNSVYKWYREPRKRGIHQLFLPKDFYDGSYTTK